MSHLVEEIEDEGLRERLLDPYDAQVEFTSEEDQARGGIAAQVLSYLVPVVFRHTPDGDHLHLVRLSHTQRRRGEIEQGHRDRAVLRHAATAAGGKDHRPRCGLGLDAGVRLVGVGLGTGRRPRPIGRNRPAALHTRGGLRPGPCLLHLGLYGLCRADRMRSGRSEATSRRASRFPALSPLSRRSR